jgi:hypothetical protein
VLRFFHINLQDIRYEFSFLLAPFSLYWISLAHFAGKCNSELQILQKKGRISHKKHFFCRMEWEKFTHVPKYVCIVMEIQYIRVAVIPSDGKGNYPKVLKNVHLCLHTGGFCDILILVADGAAWPKPPNIGYLLR